MNWKISILEPITAGSALVPVGLRISLPQLPVFTARMELSAGGTSHLQLLNMKYRCPYCKKIIEDLRGAKCPHCGRYMSINVPEVDKDTAAALGEKHRTRRRSIEQIHRQYEQKKQELHGTVSPSIFRHPTFYFGVIVILALLGALLFSAADKSAVRKKESSYHVAMRHVDVLAEALGRYRFHVGRYPTEEQGLAALVRDPGEPEWVGPYINQLRGDPWNTPFFYRPQDGEKLVLLSAGPDKKRGTDDDILPDPAAFDPGTEWTNGWVAADKRIPGVIILNKDPQAE
ncbi:MAG: type II secretion system protein GspG [Kiritimatiellia bacterium]